MRFSHLAWNGKERLLHCNPGWQNILFCFSFTLLTRPVSFLAFTFLLVTLDEPSHEGVKAASVGYRVGERLLCSLLLKYKTIMKLLYYCTLLWCIKYLQKKEFWWYHVFRFSGYCQYIDSVVSVCTGNNLVWCTILLHLSTALIN